MDLLTTHEFVISCIGYLKNIGSLNFADLPNLTLFIMQGQKLTVTNTTVDLIRKVLSAGKLSRGQWRIQVYGNLICAQSP